MKNNAKATIFALFSLLSNAIFCVQNQKRTDVETIVPSKVIFEALQPFHLQSDDIESIALRIAVAPDEHRSDFVVACHNLVTEIVIPAAVCEHDAVLIDPQHHAVIAENEYVRVLWVVQRAGKAVAAHSHQWPSVMFIITGSQFLTHGLDGSTEYETYGPGVYAFEGESDPYGFTNCGQSTFQALVVELKQTLSGQ